MSVKRRPWTQITSELRAQIGSGRLRPGDRLPSEPELCRAFDAGRHSVRRALAELAARGELRIVHGSGAFVERPRPLTYRIQERTRFRETLLAQGARPSYEHLSDDVIPAPAPVAAALGLTMDAPVIRTMRRGFADGAPVILDLSFHCAARFPDYGAQRRAGRGISEIYADYGLSEYRRRRTSLYARRADGQEARLLAQHANMPVMVTEKLDVDAQDAPIGFAQAVWSSTRVRFEIGAAEDA